MDKFQTVYCNDCLIEFKIEIEPSYDMATIEKEYPKSLKEAKYCPFCDSEDIETR